MTLAVPSPKKRSTLLVALTLLWLAAPCPSVSAQTPAELESARQKFREALSQEAANDWAGALKKLDDVARVKLTVQVRYHIARCKEHLGRHTEALGEYVIAEFEAEKASAPELAEITRARTDLAARVPKLRIKLRDADDGAKITLDGVELGDPSKEVPVNPGKHALVARLGSRKWSRSFTAQEGKVARVDLSSEDDEPAADAKPAAAKAGSDGSSGRVAPWIAGGVGAAGVLGAGVFYLLRSSAEHDLDAACRGNLCPQSMQPTQDKSDKYRLFAGISLGVGVVGLGTAAFLLMSEDDAPKPKESARRVVVDASVAPGSGGVRIVGTF